MSHMQSINAFPRFLRRSMVLCFAGLFVVLAHIFAQSVITTYVGPQMPVSGSPALSQAIDYPTAVVPDGTGGLYVLSTNQNRVYAIAVNGTLTLVAGSTYGFSGDGGPATDARLASPSGLARDAMGNLYIADTGNNRIRKVTIDGTITTIAGTGTAGLSGDGGPADAAQLSGPGDITVDGGGNIYFVDQSGRVRKIGTDGRISTVAGGGTAAVSMSGIPATSASLSPTGVAVDMAGNLYIATGFVVKVGLDGMMSPMANRTGTYGRGGFVCTQSGDSGPASVAVVCYPNRLTVDSTGNLYLTDGNLVRQITTDGIIHTLAGVATGNPCTLNGADGQPATSVCLRPFSVAVGADGSLYILEADTSGLSRSDPSRLRKVTPDGFIRTIVANNVSGFAGDGGPATSAQLSQPGPIALDTMGNLYIADGENNRVRKVTTDGVIRTIAGNGIEGSGGDGGPATAAEITGPLDLFVDGSNNVYILGQFPSLVRKITTDGVISTIAGCYGVCASAPNQDGVPATQAVLSTAQRIAVDAAGNLYVLLTDRVRKVGADGVITTVATFDSNYGVQGFALGPAGSFYITSRQTGNCRILKLSPDSSITTVAGSAPCGFGGDGDGGPATSAALSDVSAIKLDAAGNIYLIESPRVRKISTDGIIHTIAGGIIMEGFSGDGGDATLAQFNNSLTGIAVDAAGNVYISDNGNNRIRKVSPAAATQSFTLTASSMNLRETASVSGPMLVGYGMVEPAAGKTTPSGIAVFSYRPNGVLVSETAVPASPLRQSERIFAESTGAVRTGIAIANPSDQDAAISFYFTDKDGGNLNSGTTTLPAHEQTAVFLDQEPYLGPATAQTFTFNSSVPVGAVALRSYVNERSEALMTTLPVVPVSSNASSSVGAIVLPHFAAGGGWTTQVLLVNPTDQPLSGSVNMDAAYTYAIAPRSSVKITSASSDLLRTGNIVVTPTQGSGLPMASSVFSFVNNGITVTESGIATTGVAPGFQVFAESDSGQRLQTGIAVANTAAAAANAQFQLLTSDGQSTGFTGSTTLDPNGHVALFLNQIPGMQNVPASFRGILHISSNTSISAIGLRTRYNERGDFLISTTPAIADNAPSSSDEYVFPQVVSGSGYRTDFILMNPTGASQGTLSLKSQAGTELPLFAP